MQRHAFLCPRLQTFRCSQNHYITHLTARIYLLLTSRLPIFFNRIYVILNLYAINGCIAVFHRSCSLSVTLNPLFWICTASDPIRGYISMFQGTFSFFFQTPYIRYLEFVFFHWLHFNVSTHILYFSITLYPLSWVCTSSVATLQRFNSRPHFQSPYIPFLEFVWL